VRITNCIFQSKLKNQSQQKEKNQDMRITKCIVLQPHPHPPLLHIQSVHRMNIYDEGEGGLCFSNCREFH